LWVHCCCRRFCEDRRQRLSWLREEGSSFGVWWRSLSAERRKQLTTEKGEAIFKVLPQLGKAGCRVAGVFHMGNQQQLLCDFCCSGCDRQG
jgi:hypothetical protein